MVLVISAFAMQGCFNVEEQIYDELDASLYYKDENSVKSTVASLYTVAFNNYMETFWILEELSADQVAWRCWNGGSYGYDGGEKYVLSTHSWNASSIILKKCWEGSWEAIGRCTNAIADFMELDPAKVGMSRETLDAYIAEARTFRVWCYYNVFQAWGGALPLVIERGSDVPGSADADFETGTRKIWQFMADELDATVSALPLNAVNRMNQAANRMMKARLLLNAELFIGEDRYGECATLCQQIIDGDYGTYNITGDHRDIYAYDNDTCPEVVFAFANTPTQLNLNWMRGITFYHYNSEEYFASNTFPIGEWNCSILAPSYDNSANILTGGTPKSFITDYGDKLGAVYERFDDKDIRKKNYVCDDLGDFSGMFLKGAMNAGYGTGAALKADTDRQDQDLVYVDQVGTFLGTGGTTLADVQSSRWGETNSGIRLVKYPIYPAVSGFDFRDADEVEFRLAEVVYMLAECKLREGAAGEAKTLVNSVRSRYFTGTDWTTKQDEPGPGFTDFDEDWMLNEWGKEFLNEGRRRRTDLRRFDKFTQGQWWFFGRTSDPGVEMPATRDRKYEWFPLPETAIQSNPRLSQNPNY